METDKKTGSGDRGWFMLYEPVNQEIIALPRFPAPPNDGDP
jgi:hypothetical protein